MVQFLLDNPALGIVLVALFTSLIVNAIYKLTIDQGAMTRLKSELKELQGRFKEAQKSNNQKDSTKYQKRMLELSNEQLRMSLKPMVVTLIVVLPVFVWMLPVVYNVAPVQLSAEGQGTLVYQDLETPVTLTTNSEPVLEISGTRVGGTIYGKEIKFEGGEVVEIEDVRLQPLVFNKETGVLTVKRVVVTLPIGLPFFGVNMGWLGWYIICSIPFSLLTRKLLRVQ